MPAPIDVDLTTWQGWVQGVLWLNQQYPVVGVILVFLAVFMVVERLINRIKSAAVALALSDRNWDRMTENSWARNHGYRNMDEFMDHGELDYTDADWSAWEDHMIEEYDLYMRDTI